MSVEIVSWTNGTDEQIAAMLDAAAAGEIDLQEDGGWAVGDIRTVTYNDTSSAISIKHFKLVITSFAEYNGCGNLLQFDFSEIIETGFMSNADYQSYPYNVSPTAKQYMRNALAILPFVFQDRLKTFAFQRENANGTIETITGNKLALRSQREILGTGPAEGQQIAYYNTASNRIKYWFAEGKEAYSSDPKQWFLRTLPSEGDASVITETGNISSLSSNERAGFSPFGCLGGYEGPELTKTKIDEDHFPDQVLRNIVSAYDEDNDEYLNSYELEKARSIIISHTDATCKSIQGLEYLPWLTLLSISGNNSDPIQDTIFDFTHNPKLKHIYIYQGCHRVREIKINNPELEYLRVWNSVSLEKITFVAIPNKLTEIDIRNIKSGARDLDISSLTNLKRLILRGNVYQEIDIRNIPRLLTAFKCISGSPTNIQTPRIVRTNELMIIPNEDYITYQSSFNSGNNPISEDNYALAEYLLEVSPDTNIISGELAITTQPESIIASEGDDITFSCEATGSVPVSYAWQTREKSLDNEWTQLSADRTYTTKARAYLAYCLFRCKIYNEASVRSYKILDANGNEKGFENRHRLSLYTNTISPVIAALPIITKQPQSVTVPLKENATISVTASGENLQYQWQTWVNDLEIWSDIRDSGTTGRLPSFTVGSVSDSGHTSTYRCKVSNAAGAVYSNEATVTWAQSALPIIVTQPQSASVVEGEDVTFSIAASGNDLSYQWEVSIDDGETWADIRGAAASSFSFAASLGSNGNKVRCKVTNSSGSVYSDTATLTVEEDTRLSAPVIDTQPSSVSVAEGSTASFSLLASGDNLAYQWQINQNGTWYSIAGATSASYSITASLALNNARYRCQVSNAAGSIYSSEATLTVTGGQSVSTPTVTSNPRSVTLEEGQLASFRVLATGGSLSYQWQVKRNNTWYAISGATSQVLSVRAASDTNGNQYRCQVSNAAGVAYSAVATLTVSESTPLTFYGYHSIIISGKNTYGEWQMYPTSRPHVAPPEVKTSYVDVPGADGGLDYTELLNGKPNYGYRKGSWEFLLIPQEKWPEVYRSLCNFLHGREHTIVLEDDPKWTYRGRLSVNEWRSAAHNSLITIDYILEPIATSTDDEGYDPDADDLDAAGRILRKPGNEDSAIILWNGTETVVPIDSLFEDGDNIPY